MTNLTLSIDDEILEEARKKALEQGTSVNQKVREYLEQYSGMDQQKQESLKKLKKIKKNSGMIVGDITWSREEVHER